MDPDTQGSIFSVRPKCLQIWCLPSYMIQCWSASLRRDDDMCKAEDNFAKFRQITFLGAALQRLCNCDCIIVSESLARFQIASSDTVQKEAWPLRSSLGLTLGALLASAMRVSIAVSRLYSATHIIKH